jgi:hypothetical protein
MLKYETVINRLASFKVNGYLSGSDHAGILTEASVVAMIYEKKLSTVLDAVESVEPKVLRKLQGA